MDPDEDLLRVICKMLSERGWFVNAQASRINEHFEVKQCPPSGWGIKQLAHTFQEPAALCNCGQYKRGATTGGWFCPLHGQQL